MNASKILNIALGVAVVLLGGTLVLSKADNTPETSAAEGGRQPKTAASGEWHEVNVREDFSVNPFTFFRGKGLLLAVGDKESSNAMTIGWGGLGTLWGQDVLTVYVSGSRYTWDFMEKHRYFTVMSFDESRSDVLRYMGTKSGRDGDKAAALGLHTSYTEHGAPYYDEATMVIECETVQSDVFDKDRMGELGQNFYGSRDLKTHYYYTGRILKVLKK